MNVRCRASAAMGTAWGCLALATVLWIVEFIFLTAAVEKCTLCYAFRAWQAPGFACKAVVPFGLGVSASCFAAAGLALVLHSLWLSEASIQHALAAAARARAAAVTHTNTVTVMQLPQYAVPMTAGVAVYTV